MLRFILMFIVVGVSNCAIGQIDSLRMKSIYFGGGSFYIDDYQIQELVDFINSEENLDHFEVIIFSHTDNIGGKEYNEWLSQRRSQAVYNQLLAIPVPEEIIKIRDFGMENPLFTNRVRQGRQGNRRVDVILWPVVF